MPGRIELSDQSAVKKTDEGSDLVKYESQNNNNDRLTAFDPGQPG